MRRNTSLLAFSLQQKEEGEEGKAFSFYTILLLWFKLTTNGPREWCVQSAVRNDERNMDGLGQAKTAKTMYDNIRNVVSEDQISSIHIHTQSHSNAHLFLLNFFLFRPNHCVCRMRQTNGNYFCIIYLVRQSALSDRERTREGKRTIFYIYRHARANISHKLCSKFIY